MNNQKGIVPIIIILIIVAIVGGGIGYYFYKTSEEGQGTTFYFTLPFKAEFEEFLKKV